ncbi:MAG: FlgD immunoglobulin-like domain containing protein [Candidatus Eisenbacteria bacterium]
MTASNQTGVFTTVLNVFHTGPAQGPLAVPITVQVLDPAGAPEVDADVPMSFALHPARPNPFGGRTAIRYDLPEETKVRIAIFDVGGRLVRTLRDGTESAGFHSVDWDATDAHGRAVGAGIYFYSLEAGSRSIRRRAVLIR